MSLGIDVSELMSDADMGPQAITLRRPTVVQSPEGDVTSTSADTTITALVQPATPQELQMLPEGSRNGNVVSVWSISEIRVSDGATNESDVLIVAGAFFKVIKLEPWAGNGYFRAFAQGYVP